MSEEDAPKPITTKSLLLYLDIGDGDRVSNNVGRVFVGDKLRLERFQHSLQLAFQQGFAHRRLEYRDRQGRHRTTR